MWLFKVLSSARSTPEVVSIMREVLLIGHVDFDSI
jgi:hypothetical protein